MKRILIALALLFLVTACSKPAPALSQNGIEITSPFTRAAKAGADGVAYMSIRNSGTGTDSLVGASCDLADMTQVMETTMEGDVMTMKEVAAIGIPAGAFVELRPGSYHIMLMGLKQDLVEGQTLALTLEFEHAGKMTLSIPVQPADSVP